MPGVYESQVTYSYHTRDPSKHIHLSITTGEYPKQTEIYFDETSTTIYRTNSFSLRNEHETGRNTSSHVLSKGTEVPIRSSSASDQVLQYDREGFKFPTDLSLLYGIAIGILAIVLLLIIIFLCCEKMKKAQLRRVRFGTTNQVRSKSPFKRNSGGRPGPKEKSKSKTISAKKVEEFPMDVICTATATPGGEIQKTSFQDERTLKKHNAGKEYVSVSPVDPLPNDHDRRLCLRMGACDSDIRKWLEELRPSTISPSPTKSRSWRQQRVLSDPLHRACQRARLPKYSLAGEPILTSSEPSFLSAIPFQTSSPEDDKMEPPCPFKTPRQSSSLIVPTNTPNSRCSESDGEDSVFDNAAIQVPQDSDFGASAGVSHCDVSSNTSMNVVVESLASVSFAWDGYDPSFCQHPVCYVDGAYFPILENKQYWV